MQMLNFFELDQISFLDEMAAGASTMQLAKQVTTQV
jgi:hypothetical protein